MELQQDAPCRIKWASNNSPSNISLVIYLLEDKVSCKPFLVGLHPLPWTSFHILVAEMESSATLHRVRQKTRALPTSENAITTFQKHCSEKGTNKKLSCCPCTMSSHSFPASIFLHELLSQSHRCNSQTSENSSHLKTRIE